MAQDKEKPKEGRPTKYDSELHPKLAKWMARSGITDKQIAEEIEIDVATLYRWKNKYPEFCESLKKSKNITDYMVEDCLLKRALGYEYEETEIIVSDVNENPTKRVKRIKKQMAPDVTAQIFWLKNRQKERWRDVKEYQATYTPGTRKQLEEALKHINDEDYQHALEQAGLNEIH